MGWLDLHDYLLIESAARDRLDDLQAAGAAAPPRSLSAIASVSAVFRARPRDIDHHIDYFGDRALRQP